MAARRKLRQLRLAIFEYFEMMQDKRKYRMLKRCLDFAVSLSALIVFLPPMIIIAILVRCDLGAPVLLRQTRPGLAGKPFQIIKFRTMRDSKDDQGNLLPDSERLTRLGRFLRAVSLDELPEFWNVVKGDMSLVGPRPLLPEYLPLYSEEQARRHEVKPGITGWAQISGRNDLDWEDRFKLDVWYVDNRSFGLDVKILILTLWKVISREGIHQAGHATMEKFNGNRRE